MTIEATLLSIDATLKALLVSAQTGAAAAAQFDSAIAAVVTSSAPADTATPEKHTRTKKTTPATDAAKNVSPVMPGDPEGTVYWLAEKYNAVWAQYPGKEPCSLEGAVVVSTALYSAKKDEFAKKSTAAAQQPAVAPTASSATQTQAAASQSEVTFKSVVDRLTDLSKDKRPGCGRDGVMAILNKHLAALPAGERRVPKLEALHINAELLAEVDAALAETAPEVDPIFG